MDLGQHAVFIWLCYGVVAMVVAALIAWLWLDGRRRERELAVLDTKGAGRSPRAQPHGPQDAS
ncbi:MAG: heme exporter protein CcmD [Hyphomicrobiaceae bacterium]|jgi:heme exporter protein D